MCDNSLDFFFRNEGSLHTDREGILSTGEEHVAPTKEFFGSYHIDNCAAIEFARDHKGDS